VLRASVAGLAAAAAALIVIAATWAAEGEREEAGHKRPYVHRIRLLDERRNPITADSKVPYSPRQTCSGPGCHNYGAVARGMHFDMGKSLMADDWGARRGEPWELSPGMVGGFLPTFRRQYARKKNKSADEIDLTAYEFVKACGTCHPGGGAMELDRDGKRYDQRMTQVEGLAEGLDGDYHKAKWDKSGVVEIDCLMCHAQWPYNNEERIAQLRAENYKFAATAAAGFGLVAGKVTEAAKQEELEPGAIEGAEKRPAASVQYDPRLFDSQGHVTLDIARPKDQACLFCHHFPALKAGQGWEHLHWRDVHTVQGLACVECHSAGIDHDFELGRRLHWSVRPDAREENRDSPPRYREHREGTEKKETGLREQEKEKKKDSYASGEDVEPMSCERCHEEGRLGASLPRHVGFPRLHFERLACVTCHSGPALTVKKRGREPVLSDTSSSTPLTAGLGAIFPDQQAPWQIAYQPKDGQVRVHNCQVAVWWGNFVGEEGIWPLFPREVAAAFKVAGDKIADDDGDGVPEVNTDEEIMAMHEALCQVLQGGRFDDIRPVYVQGWQVRWVRKGKIKSRGDHPQATPLCVSLGHVVLGPQQALGADGCIDCHSGRSYFFGGRRIVSPFTSQGVVKTKSMRRGLGHSSTRVRLGVARERGLKPYGLLLTPLAILLCLLHYVIFGPKRVRGEDRDDEIQRFSLFERLVHFFQMLSFIVLAVTGVMFILASQWRDALSHIWTGKCVEHIHSGTGYVFVVTSALTIIRWWSAAMFRRYDKQWFRVMGGYLWMKGEAPAGKFNAGQKLLFWLLAVACVVLGATGIVMALRLEALGGWLGWAYFLHDLAAILVVPAIIGHIYLRTICNPGTLRAVFEGKVTRAWAAKHHPNWLEEIGEGE